MKRISRQILKTKKREVKDIRRNFSENVLKAAAFSVGGEFRSVEIDIKDAQSVPLFIELKSILSCQENAASESIELQGFQPLRAAKELIGAGLNSGVIVATDKTFLGGDPSWINLIKNNTGLAVIQRDFFIDPAQMYQGKAIGADAFLLTADLVEEKRLRELVEAGGEVGLEVYLEINDLRFPPNLNPESLTGIMLNLRRNANGELQNNQVETFLQSLPEHLVKFARLYPRAEAEIAYLRSIGIQAVVLNDDFWQIQNFIAQFQTIHSWCAKIFSGGRSE